MSREYIAATLKRLREQAGLTVYQVGDLVGKSGKTVSAWENNHGQPDAEMLMKLCEVYNVDDILAEFREDRMEKEQPIISDWEKVLITAYRQHPEMQPAINKMLDITPVEGSDIAEDIFSELKQDTAVHTKQKSNL